ncbi:PIN domain-containing protein [Streptomyces apricus]|uniref:PIN like domain-containing protein n=1 Tax=Streptomyces apricus TaxID=1828112 RepID=A0A5B0APJ5_9ACTN|nr:PIN domain-containing protein [Streptomyces apricus]KAA0931928.1 hypothetical protein FGF04_24020 [Streptomyces apricus]
MNSDNSFLTEFSSYRRLTKKEEEDAFNSSTIVLDANVLLDLYRVTPVARQEILGVLASVAERTHIPHQVASEFHKNRIKAAKDQIDFYEAISKSLGTLRSQTLQKLSEFANRCALTDEEKEALQLPLGKAFESAAKEIRDFEERFDLDLKRVLNDDPILHHLSEIYSGRVGKPFTVEQKKTALKEAEDRRNQKKPPGYKDGNKATNPHGDYFVWEQILTVAENSKTPILFVSNDDKEDWVTKVLDFTIGPREELVEEIQKRAGVAFHIMKFPTFLKTARHRSSESISDQTLVQAQMVESNVYQFPWKTATKVIPLEIIQPFAESITRDLESAKIKYQAALAKKSESDGTDLAPWDLDLIDQEVEFAETMLESKQEDYDLFERAISSAEETDDGISITLPEYLHKRFPFIMKNVYGSRVTRTDHIPPGNE